MITISEQTRSIRISHKAEFHEVSKASEYSNHSFMDGTFWYASIRDLYRAHAALVKDTEQSDHVRH